MNSTVLLFWPGDGRRLTGGPRTLLSLIDALVHRGLEPRLVLASGGALFEAAKERGIEVEVLEKGTRDGKRGLLSTLAALTRHAVRIWAICVRQRPRVLWTRNLKGVLTVALASRLLRLPLIWDIGFERDSNRIYRWLRSGALAISSAVVLQSRDQVSQLFPGVTSAELLKIQVLDPVVSQDRFSSMTLSPSDSRTRDILPGRRLLVVGSVHPRKNQGFLLRNIPDLSRRLGHLRVDIVGPIVDDDYHAQLHRVIDENKSAADVRFLGWRDDVPELLRSAEVLVSCSTAEGVPHVIREAMLAKTPVVATDVGGVASAIDHHETGWLVGVEDDAALVDAIAECISEPTLRAGIVQKAYTRASAQFTGENWAQSYGRIFKALL